MLRLATPVSALAVAGASLALAACGSSDGGSIASAAGANGGGAQTASFQKFQQCLKDNGVTLPGRGQGQGRGYGPPAGGGTPPTSTDGAPPAGGMGIGPGGRSADPKVRKAMQACAKYRPQRPNGTRPRQDIKAFTPYLTCLKGQGLDVKLADGFNALRNLKTSDPKVQAAFKACQSKLPQRPNGNGAGSSTAPATTT